MTLTCATLCVHLCATQEGDYMANTTGSHDTNYTDDMDASFQLERAGYLGTDPRMQAAYDMDTERAMNDRAALRASAKSIVDACESIVHNDDRLDEMQDLVKKAKDDQLTKAKALEAR